MDGPICVISGVGPGTGSALARRFSDGGCRVALLARNGERLARLESEAARARSYACDVSDPEQVERAAAAIERDLGRLRGVDPQCGWRRDRIVSRVPRTSGSFPSIAQ
jgi:NAD(P)-dependent dehydrogenase (short-subunit alcohol dehydrogenase family)